MSDLTARAAGRGTPRQREPSPLEKSICDRAWDFELGALARLLRTKFPERSIRFRSHRSLGPRPAVVHDIEFEDTYVIVTLNLGLFSSTTSLPSYFQEWLDGSLPAPGLEGLLGVLDDRLLRDRADVAMVEDSPRLLPRREAARQGLFHLARPASGGTLHWLFAALFPELGVSVTRGGVHRSLDAGDPRLGVARLGHTAIGGAAEILTPGYDVSLATGESSTWSGEPWPREARRRLDQSVFPALAHTDVHLRVLLFDFEGGAHLKLMRPSTFGFDPLERASSPHVSVLHEGRVPAGPS